MFAETATLESRALEIALAPVKNPEIATSILPLVLGFLVIELYFGKHENEELGWNTSVGNAVIWISTGVGLFMTENLASGPETIASGFILVAGGLIGYLNFFHKWSETLAFNISSPDLIYPLGYATVAVVKTDIPADRLTLKAGAAFVVASIVGSRILRMFETPARDDFAAQFN